LNLEPLPLNLNAESCTLNLSFLIILVPPVPQNPEDHLLKHQTFYIVNFHCFISTRFTPCSFVWKWSGGR